MKKAKVKATPKGKQIIKEMEGKNFPAQKPKAKSKY